MKQLEYVKVHIVMISKAKMFLTNAVNQISNQCTTYIKLSCIAFILKNLSVLFYDKKIKL